MKLKFRELWIVALLATLLSNLLDIGVAQAVSLKIWSPGETIRAADLNTNFAALNAYTANITDDRIAVNAQISHSKMKTPSLIPKAWAFLSATCTSGNCAIAESYGISSITRSSAGVYTVNLSYGPSDGDFATFVTAKLPTTTNEVFCQVTSQDSPLVVVECSDDTGVATDTAFSVMIMDSENP